MGRNRSFFFLPIFTLAFHAYLGYVALSKKCPTGLEPTVGARNRRKTTVKIHKKKLKLRENSKMFS